MSNGDAGVIELVFKPVVALGGTLLGAVTMFVGKKALEHDREIGEIKSRESARDKSLDDTFKRIDVTMDNLNATMDKILDHILRMKEK